jgi:SHAQKYF class myb-like DNA-binding protein
MTEPNKGYWAESEHEKFLEALLLYGTKWKDVQKHIGTRNVKQAKSHSQKYFNNLRRKFLRDTGKDPDFANYLLTWTLNYLQVSFFPSIQMKKFQEFDFTKLYDRLVRIFTSKIEKKKSYIKKRLHYKKTESNNSSCCCKRLGNRICDCLFDCCKEDDIEKEVDRNGKHYPIFKIEKVKKFEKILKINEKISRKNNVLLHNSNNLNNDLSRNTTQTLRLRKNPNKFYDEVDIINVNYANLLTKNESYISSQNKPYFNIFSSPSCQFASDSKAEESFYFFDNKLDNFSNENIDYLNFFTTYQS